MTQIALDRAFNPQNKYFRCSSAPYRAISAAFSSRWHAVHSARLLSTVPVRQCGPRRNPSRRFTSTTTRPETTGLGETTSSAEWWEGTVTTNGYLSETTNEQIVSHCYEFYPITLLCRQAITVTTKRPPNLQNWSRRLFFPIRRHLTKHQYVYRHLAG